ncbi:MAG: hydantoinase B/oxoprolinase family protein [Caldimicrobium sp.]|jgi:N-methylhydantoinase B
MEKLKAFQLEIFNKLLASIPEEMGVVLKRSAFSPNIRERADFSCALFDAKGELVSQASHIPVHLGAMPETMKEILPLFDWKEEDIVITNDPFSGGTHLPDITLIKPFFYQGKLLFFLLVRAHHSDVGGKVPGSMGLCESLEDEGIRILPTYLCREGRLNEAFLMDFLKKVRNPYEREGDFRAMFTALERGKVRLEELLKRYSQETLFEAIEALKNYSEKAFLELLKRMKKGVFTFIDYLDSDGYENIDIPIRVKIHLTEDEVVADFRENPSQVRGPVNAPRAVTVSASYYVFIALLNTLGEFPINQGIFRRIKVLTKPKTVVSAEYPAPVSAGNVETSQRIVDVLLGALHEAIPELIPAASCGSMNNISFGNEEWAYYETIGGGMGARPGKDGLSAVHTHMTNTMNTPIEALEQAFPVRIDRYAIRRGSGGEGKFRGGDGIIREYLFLEPMVVSLLTDRRRHGPYGLKGGFPGEPGKNYLIKKGIEKIELSNKITFKVEPGDKVRIETPGGGGFEKKTRYY